MRFAWVLAVALGCKTAPAPATPSPTPGGAGSVPRLAAPPPLVDLDAPDAAYRAGVALQLGPGWAQFLDDCRLRLPATNPLNNFALATTADITVDTNGLVVDVMLAGSGNPDFDRAVRQVIRDAAPLPKPPAALWSDDDRVHLRWLFARDRRQAGPATATTFEQALPVREVTRRLVAAGDLTRAARRIKREAAGADRDAATTDLMVAGLREALASNDGAVRRAAVEAVGAGGVGILAAEVSDVLAATSDAELRRAAMHTLADMGDHAVVNELVAWLQQDIKTDRRLAASEADALVRLDAQDRVLQIAIAEIVDRPSPNPVALYVIGLFELPAHKSLHERLSGSQRSDDPRVRAGTCAAHTRATPARAIAALGAGLKDRDARVRATCLEMIETRMAFAAGASGDAFIGSANVDRVIELVKDRDASVRGAAIRALAAIQAESAYDPPAKAPRKRHVFEPSAFPDLAADSAADVRVAYLKAVATLSMLRPLDGGQARVTPLVDDRDADVRAAAWDTLVVLLARPIDKIEADAPPVRFDQLVTRATRDPAPEVRRAVIAAIADDVLLLRVAGGDDDGETRTRALVRVATHGGRAASFDLLVGRFASAGPGSAERVRTALAWHLAK